MNSPPDNTNGPGVGSSIEETKATVLHLFGVYGSEPISSEMKHALDRVICALREQFDSPAAKLDAFAQVFELDEAIRLSGNKLHRETRLFLASKLWAMVPDFDKIYG